MRPRRTEAKAATLNVTAGVDEAEHHHAIWRSVNTLKRLSDRIVGIGPFGLGIDGVIAWLPGAGTVYSAGAAGFLLMQAVRANASGPTMLKMLAYLATDTASSGIPIIGWTFDTLFPGHMLAATALQRDIEDRHGAPPEIPARFHARKAKKKR